MNFKKWFYMGGFLLFSIVICAVGISLLSVFIQRLTSKEKCTIAPDDVMSTDPGSLTWGSVSFYVNIDNIWLFYKMAMVDTPLGKCYDKCEKNLDCAPSLQSCFHFCNACKHNTPPFPHNCITRNCTSFGFK